MKNSNGNRNRGKSLWENTLKHAMRTFQQSSAAYEIVYIDTVTNTDTYPMDDIRTTPSPHFLPYSHPLRPPIYPIKILIRVDFICYGSRTITDGVSKIYMCASLTPPPPCTHSPILYFRLIKKFST